MTSPRLQTGKNPNRSSGPGPLGRTVLEADTQRLPYKVSMERHSSAFLGHSRIPFPSSLPEPSFFIFMFWLVAPAATSALYGRVTKLLGHFGPLSSSSRKV